MREKVEQGAHLVRVREAASSFDLDGPEREHDGRERERRRDEALPAESKLGSASATASTFSRLTARKEGRDALLEMERKEDAAHRAST